MYIVMTVQEKNGKVEMKREELEKLLNEAYARGKEDQRLEDLKGQITVTPWTSPTFPSYPSWLNPTVTCAEGQ